MSISLQKNRVISFNPTKDPSGWIQWKGTNVCIDIYCSCGESSHFDGDFMYYVRCPYCSQVYEVNGYIELIAINKKEEKLDSFQIKVADK